jgi:type IV fimbrial biogenesis protein FimT
LIELMIALGISALLLTLAVPSISAFLRNTEIRSTSEAIVNGLRTARSEAVRRNTAVSFNFVSAGSASWTVKRASDNTQIQAYSYKEGAVNTVVAGLPDGSSSVTFNGLGRVMPAAAGGTPNLREINIRSALDSDARALRIYVDEARGIRMCDPSPSLAGLDPPDPRAC